jgi:hypothetical protein
MDRRRLLRLVDRGTPRRVTRINKHALKTRQVKKYVMAGLVPAIHVFEPARP